MLGLEGLVLKLTLTQYYKQNLLDQVHKFPHTKKFMDLFCCLCRVKGMGKKELKIQWGKKGT